MAITEYRLVHAPMNQIDTIMAARIAEGFQPFGPPFAVALYPDEVVQVVIKGTPDGGSGGPSTVTSDDITDASAIGRSVLTSADAAAVRSAIGAGTSSLAIGTTAATAKAGNYAPAWSEVTSKPAVIAAGADAAAARTAIGAGTSNLAVGTAAGTALAGNTPRLSAGAITAIGTLTAASTAADIVAALQVA
ncbi:hypothetical protein ABL840_26630 [Variovorax sp. NFACC27]|uniref:hypothetical protein n=1 Tax=unclassified Variovorax TaxID=663243 RepID=UPI00089AA5D5|nr:hypothetical protein SAMN03159371_03723 [Variovorax sp. NFACC28]SEG78349.1 hypothetical protein SAMN03159365_03802 [Variovorax sp. NFACC29]SFC95319.1 hypothetical protein SAMN03159379_03622 [Variovorax sp. NFACC26]SFG08573.1 hypothetical protein SAMN03159447_01730 [Variovorax sp. NFACC27]